MKKAFTFIEVILSITIFSIVLIMMYKTLNLTKQSDNYFSKITLDTKNINRIKKIIFEDFIEVLKIEQIYQNLNDNDIFILKTSNIFHEPSNAYVTYFVSKKNNLIRLESKNKIDIKIINYDLLDNASIDILIKDVDSFKISSQHPNYVVAIKIKDKKRFFINTIVMNIQMKQEDLSGQKPKEIK